MKDTIKKLVEMCGPSGAEDQVRAWIRSEIEGLADEVRTDTMGNLIALKKGDGTGLKVMLSAHMDEIGVIVSYIDEKGFVSVNPIGGVRPLYEVAGRVLFEMTYPNEEIAREALRRAQHKLPIKTRIVTREEQF